MIYLDYNATTPLCDAAREAMLPYLDRHFGNPSSVHAAGREARAAIDNARDKLAALLHSDMVQSFGKMQLVIPSEVEESRDTGSKVTPRDPSTSPATAGSAQDDIGSLVDAASFAAHKFYGPKGVGFLFLRSGLSIQPIMFGGAHENERRPGTENVAAIVGMAAAAEWVEQEHEKEQEREKKLRDELWTRIAQNVPDAKQNGANAPRLANTL